MDSKARILKMLEDGLITTKEAIDLMNALNEDDQDKKHTSDKKEEENSIYKFFENMTDEVGKILDPDTIQKNAKETFDDVRRKAKATKSTSDILKTLEDVFDKAKTGDIDAIFQQGSKNKLIETIEEDFSSVTLDVTNGNVEVKKTDGVTAVRFEVTPFYRKLDKKRNYFEDIFCEVKNGNLEIMSPLRSAKVNVVLEINERALDHLHISSSNGSVDVEDLLLKDLSIDILNGDIEVEDISAKHAFVRTSRGSLDVKESAFTNLELVSMLGTISTKELDVEEIDIKANGSVSLSLNEDTRDAKIQTNMGSINVEIPSGRKVEGRLNTVLGHINYPPGLNIRDMKPSDLGLKEIMIINDTDESGLVIEASTKVGSVTLHTV
ncbi:MULTISPECIES: DUF4097 family beta strand repeat-containing protein [Nosocomiicoccus]|uniref:DUF4097 family beta strand repeat-containing protein n=1 Tax=Nosocomiicoccus massiliensis TaxID=1232430 RepID=A0AAF0YHH0_9STAP|nr:MULTISPECIES: DUF4097 family beta strand repeat-containing protein [Nosocomiicoccus]MDK6863640.1 DUF4097 family beta strand repeat-containing protein [Nosocomiicoccus ampullae]WOS95983.1 DUF4097 family beta strand repeat-containing protein [Nosocomiicoccus massiliensis]